METRGQLARRVAALERQMAALRGHTKGIVAIGDVATGVVALGRPRRGAVAFGGRALGERGPRLR